MILSIRIITLNILHKLQLPGHFEAIQVNQIELHFPKFSNNLIAASQLLSDPTKIRGEVTYYAYKGYSQLYMYIYLKFRV
jgi:hypothetical protein